MKKIIIVFTIIFSFACGQAKSVESVKTANQTSQTQVNTEVKTGDSTGVVTKINRESEPNGSIELDHEEIKGIMPKMLMEFYVKDKKMLDGLKVGDKVDFTLEDNKGAEMIIKLSKSSDK